MPSFDVVSKLSWPEVDNALNQSRKEIAQRYDFKDTNTTIEKNEKDKQIVIVSASDGRVEAAWDVLSSKLVKRQVSLKHFEVQDAQQAGGQTIRQVIKVAEGIDRDKARKIIDLIKQSKIKVQASIHEDTVRVSGKNRDDLQATIKLLREASLEIELQYINFRE